MSITMSESAIKERFRLLDVNRDGVLDFEEFYEWISEDDCDMSRKKAQPIFDQVADLETQTVPLLSSYGAVRSSWAWKSRKRNLLRHQHHRRSLKLRLSRRPPRR
eukprot:Skav233055  [mRNA]  locus=scaffold3507:110500:115258:+ [translate_table: standard]